jgi:hypothetical protein
MVASDAAAEIGIGYADSDPIFFPYSDGELYSIPLPDGQYFTVNGVVDDESVSEPTTAAGESDGTEQTGYTVDQLLVYAAQSTDVDIETVIERGVASLLKDAIDDTISDLSMDWSGPRTSVDVSLPDRHERLLNGLVEDDTIQATQVSHLLDAALLRELELADESESIEIDPIVLSAVDTIATEKDESTEQFIEQTLRDAVKRDQQNRSS